MSEPDYQLVPTPSAQLALAKNHLALLNKILPPAIRGPVPGRSWEIEDLGLKMVWIEPGSFLMGSEDYSLEILTPVTISRGYWLATKAVTQIQWELLMGDNPSFFKAAYIGNHSAGDMAFKRMPAQWRWAPVENVSWDDTLEFCRKLTARERAEGRLSANEEYTLPSAAQWEYACRAGTTGDYAGDLDAMAWYRDNSQGTTQAVGGKYPNAWDLYDMHGNVFEWCRDWYQEPVPVSIADPTGPVTGTKRVFCGGSWLSVAEGCRSAFRGTGLPSSRNQYLGFRVALVKL